MSKKPESRFRFVLLSDDEELNDYVSYMFSCFSQMKATGDLTKRIRSNMNELVGSAMRLSDFQYGGGWCVLQGKEMDKALRYISLRRARVGHLHDAA